VIWNAPSRNFLYSLKDGVWTQHKRGPYAKEGEVYAAVQDRRGTLWFATALGITRYEDGRWKYCEHPDGLGHPNSIAGPGYANEANMFTGEVWALLLDRRGHIWAGTFRGVSRFDGRRWKQYTEADGVPPGGVNRLYEDREGNIWASGSVWTPGVGGLSRYDGTRWTLFRTGKTGSIKEDAEGMIWACTEEGIGRLDLRRWHSVQPSQRRQGTEVISQPAQPPKLVGGTGMSMAPVSDNDVLFLTRDRQGRMIVKLPNELLRYDGLRFEPVKLPAKGLNIRAFVEDSESNIWVAATYGGIWRLTDGTWQHYGQRPKSEPVRNKIGPDDWSCVAIAEDASGRVWFGGGLRISVFDGEFFDTIRRSGFDESRKSGPMTLDRQGRMWIANIKVGVQCFDARQDTNGTVPSQWTEFGTTNGLPDNEVVVICVDRNGHIWAGTDGGGVARYDGVSWKLSDRHDGLGGNKVKDLKEDRDGRIWAAHGDSVSFFDGVTWTVLDARDGMSLKTADRLLPDNDGSMWMGGQGGLLRYTPQRREVLAPNLRMTGEKIELSGDNLKPGSLTERTRLTFEFGARDFLTQPTKLQFRYQWIEGSPKLEALKSDAAWSKPTFDRRLEWSPDKPGTYSLAVQFIDRDLNYSKPALALLTIVPLWYNNARIMVPAPAACWVCWVIPGSSHCVTVTNGARRSACASR